MREMPRCPRAVSGQSHLPVGGVGRTEWKTWALSADG